MPTLKLNHLLVVCLVFTAAILAPIIATQTKANDTDFALLAMHEHDQRAVCVHQSESTLLAALQDNGFNPKQDDTDFIYSLIGFDGPVSSDPAAQQAFWGFWTQQSDGGLTFNNLGPAQVQPTAGTLYVMNFGNGQTPTVATNFQEICRNNPAPVRDNPTPTTTPTATKPTTSTMTSSTAEANISAGLRYLQDNFASQAAANRDWAAMALGAYGQTVTLSPTDGSSVLGQARHALALAAQGQDRTGLIQDIESQFHDNQFGDPKLINDDIFAVLAVQSTDPGWLVGHQAVFDTIIHSQRRNGSFGFSTSGDGDVDITSASIWALEYKTDRPTESLNKAFNYLQSAQNENGGYGFQPKTDSNIASSSWALIAYNTDGQTNNRARQYLINQQQPNGNWLFGDSPNYLNSAYAMLALSGKKLPIIGTTPPAQIPTPAPAPAPTAPAESNLHVNQTGSSQIDFSSSVSSSSSTNYSANVSVNGQSVISESRSNVNNCEARANVTVTYDGNGQPVTSSTSGWICY